MTNKDKLIQKLEKMTPKRLAEFLNDTASAEINDLICKQCLKANNDECLMELRHLKNCPRKISDWLQEEAC
jgi:hypothetical protein